MRVEMHEAKALQRQPFRSDRSVNMRQHLRTEIVVREYCRVQRFLNAEYYSDDQLHCTMEVQETWGSVNPLFVPSMVDRACCDNVSGTQKCFLAHKQCELIIRASVWFGC